MKSLLITLSSLFLFSVSSFAQCCVKLPESTASKGKSLSYLKSYKWPERYTLRVSFLEGTARQVAETKKHIDYIDSLCGIKVRYVSKKEESDVRIAFDLQNGHWSYLGKSSLQIAQNVKTMNLALSAGLLGDPKEEWHRVVCHEFLHALGFVHEHSVENANKIVWNKESVYRYYKATQGWSKSQVDKQVLFKYSVGSINGTAWDKNSIMQYPIKKGLANIEIPWNNKLSANDVSFLKKTYGEN